MKNPARRESAQSSAFRRQHTVVHVLAIMHILRRYRGTYIWGEVLSWHCSRQQISVMNEGVLIYGVLRFIHEPWRSLYADGVVVHKRIFWTHMTWQTPQYVGSCGASGQCSTSFWRERLRVKSRRSAAFTPSSHVRRQYMPVWPPTLNREVPRCSLYG